MLLSLPILAAFGALPLDPLLILLVLLLLLLLVLLLLLPLLVLHCASLILPLLRFLVTPMVIPGS